jgi:tetratricopeptide (TPR) repeat protein
MKQSEVSDYVTSLNVNAMKCLKIGNTFKAQKLLNKATKALSNFPLLKNLHTVTLNNLGCYYKWIKKPKIALKCLEQSIALQKNGSLETITLAGTYVNTAALHSDIGNHNLALNYIQDAVNLLKDSKDQSEKSITTLTMGYHSMALENLYLKNYKEAIEYFEIAKITSKKLPDHNKIIEFIEKSYKEAEKKIKLKDKNEFCLSDYKKLPKVNGNGHRTLSTPSACLPSKKKIRFLTGDRLKPMFPQNFGFADYDENKHISKTLENIQQKIDFLQTKLENFHKCVEPLKKIHENKDLSDTFSMQSIENLELFKLRNISARKIQKFFRKYLKKPLKIDLNSKLHSKNKNLI